MVYLGQGRLINNIPTLLTKANTPKSQWRVIPNTHEPLVSREDFEKIQQILENVCKERKAHLDKREEQRNALPDILKGKFFCYDCGRVMLYSRNFRNGVSHFRDYCCSGYLNDKKAKGMDNVPKCRKEKYSLEERCCKTLLFDQIKLQLEAGLRLEKLTSQLAENDESKRKELAEAVRIKTIEVHNISSKLQRLYEDYRDKIIDRDDYLSIRQVYAENQKTAQDKLNNLKDKLNQAEGKCTDNEWTELKARLAEIAKNHTETDNSNPNGDLVEIIEEDEPPIIPGTERLTQESVDEMNSKML